MDESRVGVFASLRRLLKTVVAIAQNRLELLLVEMQEERWRFFDALLLTGAVRVALGQLSRSTQVRLRVPPAELDLWTEAIALVPNLALKPSVVAGEGMGLGECEIETELGSVDLGIRAQLGEIERGFFDRAGGPRAEPAVLPDRAHSAGPEIRP